MEYFSFPFVKFCKIFQDESKLKDYGISEEDWAKVKEGFNQSHPSEEEKALIEAYKIAIKASIELNKFVGVLNFILQVEGDWEEYFEISGIKYTGDPIKDGSYLKKLIQKAETKTEVFQARFIKLQEEIKKAQEKTKKESKPISQKDAYKALAGLEKLGATIPDFETFTCGKYDAWNEIIKESNKNPPK